MREKKTMNTSRNGPKIEKGHKDGADVPSVERQPAREASKASLISLKA
jgi:hypothetical protein